LHLLVCRFVGDFLGEPEVEGINRTGLDAEGLLVFANAVAAHGAFAGLAGDLVFSDDFPRAGVNAVLAADADILIDDHGAFFVFGESPRPGQTAAQAAKSQCMQLFLAHIGDSPSSTGGSMVIQLVLESW
jgi:hypothetical protein